MKSLPQLASRSPPVAALDLVRDLRRTTRHLGDMLSQLRPSDYPQAAPSRSGVRWRVRHALVVSSNEASRCLLLKHLSAAGFIVEWAADANQARQKAAGSPPDVVIVERAGNEPLTEPLLGARLTIVVQSDSSQHSAEIARIAEALKGMR